MPVDHLASSEHQQQGQRCLQRNTGVVRVYRDHMGRHARSIWHADARWLVQPQGTPCPHTHVPA